MSISLTGFPAYVTIVIFLALIALIPMYILSKARRKTYEFAREYDTIVKTEYEAPYSLTPAELGYLADAKFSKREFFATVLDLEQRGYIQIHKTTPHSFELTRVDGQKVRLTAHEQIVVENFTNTTSLSLSNIQNLKMFKQAVIDSLHSKGLVKKLPRNTSFLAGRIVGIFFLINFIVSSLFAIAGDSSIFDRVLFFFLVPILITPITLPLSMFLGFVYHRIVGETGLWTKDMKKAWVEVAGYQDFIKKVELDNIQFESAELKSKTKIKAFPYAVALGLRTDWEERFRK